MTSLLTSRHHTSSVNRSTTTNGGEKENCKIKCHRRGWSRSCSRHRSRRCRRCRRRFGRSHSLRRREWWCGREWARCWWVRQPLARRQRTWQLRTRRQRARRRRARRRGLGGGGLGSGGLGSGGLGGAIQLLVVQAVLIAIAQRLRVGVDLVAGHAAASAVLLDSCAPDDVQVVEAVLFAVAQWLRVVVGRPAEHTATFAIPLDGCTLQASELGRVVVRAETRA